MTSIKNKLFISFSMLIILSGCTKLEEEPVGLLAPETFFNTPADAEAAVMGSYSMMTVDGYYGRKLPLTLQLLGDLVDIADIGTASRRVEINNFRFDGNNEMISQIWSTSYRIIGSANAAIEGIPRVDMNEEEKNELIAEARMVRALAYFHLVQLFGDVPYIEDFVTDPSSVSDISRTPASEVYQQIIEDVEYATTALPDVQPNDVRSRPTKGTAHTLLAKIYLVLGEWAKAAENAQHVINNAGTYGYQLVPDYATLWDANQGDIDEHIWTIDFLGGVSGESGTNDDFLGALSGVRNADMQGWSVMAPSPGIYEFFPNEDYRKEVSFLTETLINGEVVPYTEWTWPRIHIGKWSVNPGENANSEGRYSDHNYVIFRYAEILLIAAEALNEANGGPTAKAYEYVNEVRQRSGNSDLEPGMSQEEFREAIRDERIFELAFEWKRWYDLKRWGIVEEAFTLPNSFEPRPNIKSFHRLLPIPQDEIGRNSNLLPQNEGY